MKHMIKEIPNWLIALATVGLLVIAVLTFTLRKQEDPVPLVLNVILDTHETPILPKGVSDASNESDLTNNSVTSSSLDAASSVTFFMDPNYRSGNECTHSRLDIDISPDEKEKTIYPLNLGEGNETLMFIRNTESNIGIWEREEGIVKSGTCNDWWRISDIIPENTAKVMVLGGSGCTFNIPSTDHDDEIPDVQIVFYVYYKTEIGLSKGDSNYYYYLYSSNTQNRLQSQQRRKWSKVKPMKPACYDIYIRSENSMETKSDENKKPM